MVAAGEIEGMALRDGGQAIEGLGLELIDAEGRVVGVVSRTDLVKRYTDGDSDYDPRMLVEIGVVAAK